jgi:hypothetical protein
MCVIRVHGPTGRHGGNLSFRVRLFLVLLLFTAALALVSSRGSRQSITAARSQVHTFNMMLRTLTEMNDDMCPDCRCRRVFVTVASCNNSVRL